MRKVVHFPDFKKIKVWSFSNASQSDKHSEERHSCDKKTCHGQTCAYTCKNTCETCEKTHCPGNTDEVCCA